MKTKDLLLELMAHLKHHICNMERVEYHVRDHSLEWTSEVDSYHYLMELTIHEYRPFKDYFENDERYDEFKHILTLPEWNKYIPDYPEVKEFIIENYSYNHLTQRQLSRLSGIPQPTLFAIIKHMKLKSMYPEMQKKDRIKLVQDDGTLINLVDPKPKLPISRRSATKKKWKKKK